jgi:hypothetical protein
LAEAPAESSLALLWLRQKLRRKLRHKLRPKLRQKLRPKLRQKLRSKLRPKLHVSLALTPPWSHSRQQTSPQPQRRFDYVRQ